MAAFSQEPKKGAPVVSSSSSSVKMKFELDDRVFHSKRPEWGPGIIIKIENSSADGQRLQIRFSAAGLKVINTAYAPLVHAAEYKPRFGDAIESINTPPKPLPTPVVTRNNQPTVKAGASQQSSVATNNGRQVPTVSESPAKGNGWLASLEKRDPEAVMLEIPEAANDPFSTTWDRLQASIDLYRFTSSPHSLTDWSIAQSGLADPLTKFNRQELETLFARWTRIRNQHLFTILLESEREDPARAKAMLANAPAQAQQAMRQLYARR